MIITGLYIIPGIVVSIEHGRSNDKVDILRERSQLGLHLSSIPEGWSMAVIFTPWIKHLVGILTNE